MFKRKKQRENKEKKHAKTQAYQPKYLAIGTVTIFISIVALFNWGVIGVFMTNLIRLLVGQAYDLVFTVALVVGAYMVIEGRMISIRWRPTIGIVLILSSITTWLHLNAFYPQEPMSTAIFQETWAIFRNELLTNQLSTSLGGGLLGSVFYSTFGYLFGQWGTYLLIGILFFAGLFLLVGITAQGISTSALAFFRGIQSLFTDSFPSFEEVKAVFNQEREAEQSNQASEPQLGEDELMVEDESRSSRKKMGFIDRVKAQFSWNQTSAKNTNAAPSNDPLETEYQPIFKKEPANEWETFKQSDALAQTAAEKRQQALDEQILDLDYFDEMAQAPNSVHTHPAKFQSNFSDQTASPELDLDALSDTHPADTEQPPVMDEEDFASGELVPEKPINNIRPAQGKSVEQVEEDVEVDVDETAKLASGVAASRWQDQADASQNLTHDDLEQTLEEGNKAHTNDKPAKKKAKKRGKQSYQLPPKDLLTKMKPVDQSAEYQLINENIDKLEVTFESFGVDAKVVKANLGPSVTKYEIEPAIGVKVSKIVSLSDDIALALAARDVRIEAPIPGKSLIGIEVPNTQISPVSFWEVIDPALNSDELLEVPLGRDVTGSVSLADLTKMPHLLIAGATGSGKSVGMNVIICSLLMKATPDEVKFLMIDPKKVELTMYNDLPHQLSPVVTNPRKAAKALNNVVQEMERRYELFASLGVRNADGYNDHVDQVNKEDNTVYEKLPKIVVFIDELADLMLVASNEVENSIIRLAQMARAAGIHMIIATQRPSVDVITGIIKANIPSRLAFAVSSGTDSRTILDGVGAEKLLGRGDMLFQPMGRNKPIRVQGAYISDQEVERITDFIKDQETAEYDENIVVSEETMEMASASDDEYFEDAIELIRGLDTISISQLQRQFRVGYNRAARLVDDMEAMGYVSEADGSKPRKVLISE